MGEKAGNARPKIQVRSVGSALPSRAIANDDLARLFGPGVAAAAELGGVSRRFWAADVESAEVPIDECTSALCAKAARAAMQAADVTPREIDLLIVSTYTPDYQLPGTIPRLLERLKLGECTAYELRASCSGLGIALVTAEALLRSRRMRTALVVCAELNSIFLPFGGLSVSRADWINLALFSDGASAFVLRAIDEVGAEEGLLACFSKTLPPDGECPLVVRGGGTVNAPLGVGAGARLWVAEHDPKRLESVAPVIFQRSIRETLRLAGVELEQVKVIIPPQANGYLYAPLLEEGKPCVYLNVDRFGNTTSASIGIALEQAVREGRVSRGDLVLLLPFSAAKFVCAGALVRWCA